MLLAGAPGFTTKSQAPNKQRYFQEWSCSSPTVSPAKCVGRVAGALGNVRESSTSDRSWQGKCSRRTNRAGEPTSTSRRRGQKQKGGTAGRQATIDSMRVEGIGSEAA